MAGHDWLNGSSSEIQSSFGERYGRSQPPVRHELRPLTTGEILDRTFFLYRSNFWLYVGLASIAAGASVLASIGKLTYFHFNAGIQATSPKAMLGSVVIPVCWSANLLCRLQRYACCDCLCCFCNLS